MLCEVVSKHVLKAVRLGAAAAVFVGCSRDTPPRPVTQGIEIDTSALAQYEIDIAGGIEVGAAHGQRGQLLNNVVGALIRADAGLVIGNQGTGEIFRYNSQGAFEGATGRQGEGPGEFRLIRTLSRGNADSLTVYDAHLDRVTVLSPEGRYSRSFAPSSDNGLGLVWGSGGQQFVRQRGISDATGFRRLDGIWQDTAQLDVIEAEGAIVSSIEMIPGDETIWLRGAAVARPMGQLLKLAIGSSIIYTGTGKEGTINRHDMRGRPLAPFLMPPPPTPTKLSAYNAALKRVNARTSSRSRERVSQVLASAPAPDFQPDYSRLLVDADDNLWVALYSPPQESTTWWIIEPDGKATRTVVVPTGWTLMDASANRVLLRRTDELGVEYVSYSEYVAR